MTATAFGAALREWREVEGLTGDQAAARFGVSRQTLYRWEAGTMVPAGDNAETVKEATGLEVPGARSESRRRLNRVRIVPTGGEVIEVDGVARVEGGFVVVTEAAGIVTIYPAHALARVVVTPF